MKALRWLVALWVWVVATEFVDDAGITHEPLGLWPIVLALQWLSTVAHELGHFAAARQARCRVVSIVAIPLGYDFESRRLRVVGKTRGSDLGGYVQFVSRPGLLLRESFALFGAGIAVELLIGVALLIGLGLTGNLHPPAFGPASILPSLARAFATLAIGGALSNLLPVGGSDGALMLRLARSAFHQRVS